MKKFTIILFVLIFALPFGVFAIEEPFGDDPLDVGGKKPFLIEDRLFEVGLAHLDVFFANDFLSLTQIFQDTLKINLDDFKDGFNINFGLGITPFYINVKSKKGWGFGFATSVESMGVLGLSGKMLTLSEATKELSDIGGALFAAATISTDFKVQKFKVKVNPSLFYTLAYVKKPALTYTMSNKNGTIMYINYDLQVYTAIPMENFGEDFNLTGTPGFDISAGVEYPLAKEIGLTKLLPFLDFDVSLDFINVPIVASRLKDRMRIEGSVGDKNNPIDFTDLEKSFSFNGGEVIFDSKEEIMVTRPFKMLLSADWRPLFGSKLLTVIPVIGFSVNPIYNDVGSIEAGLNGRLSLANCFIAVLGFNYTDRMFVNSLDLALNLRAFELNLGVDIRSQDIKKSWEGAGVGVNFGLKFGW